MMILRPYQSYNHVVSLGMACQVQWYLKMRGLSCPNIGPFNNVISNRIDTITETLLSPDRPFFSEDQVYIKGVSHSDKTKWIVGSRHLDGVYSTHDFAIDTSDLVETDNGLELPTYTKIDSESSRALEGVEQILNKLSIFNSRKKTQIFNMVNVIKCTPTVLLIRVNRPKEKLESIVRLRDTIASMRDGKPFDLWVFQNATFMSKDWGVLNLKTFLDDRWIHDGKKWTSKTRPLWDRLFDSVKLAI